MWNISPINLALLIFFFVKIWRFYAWMWQSFHFFPHISIFFSRVKMLDSLFNIDNGYLEGLVRGFKNGILKQTDYLNLVQCESLDGKAQTKRELFTASESKKARVSTQKGALPQLLLSNLFDLFCGTHFSFSSKYQTKKICLHSIWCL